MSKNKCNSGFKEEVMKPNLYEGTPVREINGAAALAELHEGKFGEGTDNSMVSNKFKKPELLVMYRPTCPHCHEMQYDYIALAQLLSEHKVPVQVSAMNLSRSMAQVDAYKIDGAPTIRLYTAPKEFVEYEGWKPSATNLVMFLEENGVKIPN